MSSADSNKPPPRQPKQTPQPPTPQSYTFQQLSGGAKEVIIDHEGAHYRLRLTRNGKLILGK